MATETVKLTYDYGKYKYFEFTGGSGSTVNVEFTWDSPKIGPDKRPIPKNVVELFNKNVRTAIQDLMKSEETTVNAIKKRLQEWEQKISKHQIDGQQLFGFINMVNDTLAERAKDLFAAVGGIATVMKMIVKRAFAGLDQAVRDMLDKEKWIIQAKTVGKVVLALTAVALSIVATVLTGGAALPLVILAGKITVTMVVEGKAAYDGFSAGADEVVALQEVLKKHRSAAQDAMKAVARTEAKRYLMADTVVKLEAQAAAAETKYAEVERVLSQKKINGVTISEDGSLIALVTKVGQYRKLVATLNKKLAESKRDLEKLDELIEGARRAFDPTTYDKIPSADWKTILKKYAEDYGSTIKMLGQMGESISTIVQKMA